MKRFVSILAVLALVLSLIPAAFAEDSYIAETCPLICLIITS